MKRSDEVTAAAATSTAVTADAAGCKAYAGPPADIHSARAMFAALQTQATHADIALRTPPPEPTTCCGRGCNGCVWEGFYASAEFWRQDAVELLSC